MTTNPQTRRCIICEKFKPNKEFIYMTDLYSSQCSSCSEILQREKLKYKYD